MHSLIPQYREMHRRKMFQGTSLRPWVGEIGDLIFETGAKTLLDYGCGAGTQYRKERLHRAWGIMPTLYDPGFKPYSRKPKGTFDGVICTDVLEHIPERELPAVLTEIFGYARLFVFLSICCREAKRTFPDGSNVHVTIRPQDWWLALVKRHNPGIRAEIRFTP